MTLAILNSAVVLGTRLQTVRVEVHVAGGLSQFSLVGLADAEVRESRERVRAAIQSAGFEFPIGRLTVNLAPADLPKQSGRFDLAMALGILMASGQAPHGAQRIASSWLFAAELSLTGALVCFSGMAALMAAWMREPGVSPIVLPMNAGFELTDLLAHATDTAHTIRGAATLVEALQQLADPAALPCLAMAATAQTANRGAAPCLSQVHDQAAACRQLEIAATGAHHLLLIGPPGAGKTLLAERLPGLLPPATLADSLETRLLHGLHPSAGAAPAWGNRPFRRPHHGTSAAALVGGGRGIPRPGEISLAHGGVLFLDEFPEFSSHVLEQLREPLETGEIHLARSGGSLALPAAFQLVAAMNPCPCGAAGSRRLVCRCTPEARHRYLQRLSGPLLDRIDLVSWLEPPDPGSLLEAPATGQAAEPSARVRERVVAAQAVALARQGVLNARLTAGQLEHACAAERDALSLLAQTARQLNWSGRAVHRVLRVARSIADLDAKPAQRIASHHMAEAIQSRRLPVLETAGGSAGRASR